MLALKCSPLNRETIVINFMNALASIIFMCSLYYTQIFYMVDKVDIPSIQCKMRLRGPKCMSLGSSQSHIATDGHTVCLSWCRAPSGAHDQILITV
jgi:hypothetical protein